MENSLQQVSAAQTGLNSDRAKELKAFDDSKAGVKGLVDAGILKIPEIFVMPTDEIPCKKSDSGPTQVQIPVIDLKDMHEDCFRRKEIVEQVQRASEKWGFFQILNHGIAKEVMDEMIEGVRRFNEQPKEEKMEYYTREMKKVRFLSNFDLYQAKATNWRDTLICSMAPDPPNAEELPAACRKILMDYSKQMKKLGRTLFELLSEALGLHPNHLIEMECEKGHTLIGHYYPACPEPDRTLGISGHSDPDFFTVLLQDEIGGLQVLHQNQWVDISPLKEALVVNLGDLLQLISNDKFKSAEHRVQANRIGPRISVASFFSTHNQPFSKPYGPIKELLADDNPPLYRETLVSDYVAYYSSRGLGSGSALAHLRL